MNPQLLKFAQSYFPTPGRALDLGCGDGTDMLGLKELGWGCDGVDLKTGTDLNSPYLSNTAPYDLVYANFVIQKLEKPEILAETIANNLKQNGKFFIQTFHNTDPYTRKTFSSQEITQLLSSAKLNVEKVFFFPFDEGAPDFHHHIVLQATGKK